MLGTNGDRRVNWDGIRWAKIMVPVALVRVLSDFVVLHYASRGLRVEAEGMAQTCSVLARSWAIENHDLIKTYDLTIEAVSAFGARFGKHLGEFFNQEGRA